MNKRYYYFVDQWTVQIAHGPWSSPSTGRTRVVRSIWSVHSEDCLEEQPFEYMFLRPRRWGKSTFLNMLAAYYDVKTKDSFEEIFGGLHIGKVPTVSRNSHLILLFDFLSITPTGSFMGNCQSIFKHISLTLRRFLLKYQDILGNALPEEYIIPNDIATSLENVLVSKFRAKYDHGTKHDNRISFFNVAIPLSLASMSTMLRSILV